MSVEALVSALRAVNAAWSGARVFGPDHPSIARRVAEAASQFRRAADADPSARVLWLPGRVVVGNRTLAQRDGLHGGVFASMGTTLPNGLQVGKGATEADVLALIEALSSPSEEHPGAIVGPFVLVWIRSGAGAAGTAPDDAAPDHAANLRALWATTGSDEAPATSGLEGLAAGMALATRTNMGAFLPLADLKRHDEYTFVHAVNVGLMASALCDAVGLSAERTRDITIGAVLHDVGKQGIPERIISKQGKLTDRERAIVQSHPAAGARILAGRQDLPPVVISIAYEHHMGIDGGGYPHTPAGWRLALPSQIVHIADVFDALRTHRPYRRALPVAQALEIMQAEAGRCYDAELFRVFVDRVVNRVTRRDDAAGRRMPDAA